MLDVLVRMGRRRATACLFVPGHWRALWDRKGVRGAHLVALVDAVDELGTRGAPGTAHCGGVDGFSMHITRGHSGH